MVFEQWTCLLKTGPSSNPEHCMNLKNRRCHRRKRSTSRSSSSSEASSITFKKSNIWRNRLLIISAAVICFAHTFDGEFVFDDEEAIVHNKDVTQTNPILKIFTNDFWGNPISSNSSHKSYRPLTTLTFRLNHLINGLDVRGYHVVNIILHAVTSLLTYELYRRILDAQQQETTGLIASLVFALHPVHTECVANVVGRAELLASVWFVASLLCYDHYLKEERRRWLILTVFLAAVSMFSKEQGVTVLAVCVAYDVLVHLKISPQKLYNDRISLNEDFINNNEGKLKNVGSSNMSLRWLYLAVSAVLLLIVRLSIMSFTTPTFSPPDNPASFLPTVLLRVVNYMYIYCLNLWLLLNPNDLCFDYSMGCIPLIQSLYDPRILISLAFALGCIAILYKFTFKLVSDRLRISYFALSLMVLTFLPSSNLFFRVGFVLAERVLYLPSVGFCLLLAVAFTANQKRSINPIIGLVLVLYFIKSSQRALEWRSERTLYASGLRVCPKNAKVHYNLAKVLSDSGQITLAQDEYREALRLRPDYEQAMNNLANLLKDHGGFLEAEKLLISAVQLKSNFAAAWMNLGIVRSNLQKYSLAENAYWKALDLRKPYADCWFNLGNLYLQQGRNSEALSAWRNATRQRPTHAKAWINQMVMYDTEGSCSQAVIIGEDALGHIGGHGGIHFTVGGCYGKLGMMHKAEMHLIKAINAEPDNGNYYGNLGVLYHRWNKTKQAKSLYIKALNMNPELYLVRDNLRILQIAH